MSKQIIPAGTNNTPPEGTPFNEVLHVSEFFCDTIQGEGINIGVTAAFLRLAECSLNCIFCDTTEVWQQGSHYSFHQLFKLMEGVNLIEKFIAGQHLVITGGSPLKQQNNLILFLNAFKLEYGFMPYIEIENEAVYKVQAELAEMVDCWNNSPKLANSGNSRVSRYKPEAIHQLTRLENSWFKFVVDTPDDWEEIKTDFLVPLLISKSQIILMPEGATRNELLDNNCIAAELAIKHGVRYCSREHVMLWDKKTGV